jgi:acetylornithine deacetylase/succinyl-diaminopimelate desuccinylase-like protein
VTYDRRLLPGEMPESVLQAVTTLPDLQGVNFNATLAQGEHRTHTGAVLRGPKFFPAWLLAEDHPFVQTALSGLDAAGLTPQLGTYRFCTNAAYSAGMAGVPTVGFGPGAEGDAHVVDEHLELAALERAAQGYQSLAAAVLGAL